MLVFREEKWVQTSVEKWNKKKEQSIRLQHRHNYTVARWCSVTSVNSFVLKVNYHLSTQGGPSVMGKSQIKSHCQISNHSVNRFKSCNQISDPIFPSGSNILVTNHKSNLKSFIFVLNFVHWCFKTSETWYMYSGQWSQSVTAIQLVSHSELNCVQSSSASTVRAVSRALRLTVLAISRDLTIFQIKQQNIQIKSQVK